jgi:LppX_LprAFG lipoprotein
VRTRRPSVRRRIAAVVSAPLLLVSFAACGTDDGKGEAGDEPTALQSGDAVTVAQFAALTKSSVDKATTAHMTMDMTMGRMGSIHAEGDLAYEDGAPSMQMTMEVPGAGGQMDLVLVDSTMYLKMPGVSGGKYVEIDLSDTDSLPPELADMVDQMDPLKSVKEFGDAVDEVTFEGSDEVGGETLDHYLVSVDTTKVDQLKQLESQGVDLPDTVEYDFWLDADGMLRQMTSDFTIMGKHMSVEVDMDQWGEDVSIEAPPASQTRPMPGLTTAG